MSDEANEDGAKEELQDVVEKAEDAKPAKESNPKGKANKTVKVLQLLAGGFAFLATFTTVVSFVKEWVQDIQQEHIREYNQSEWNRSEEAIVSLYDGSGKFLANGFLVADGDKTYVYTARHPIIANYNRKMQSAEAVQIRSDIRMFLGKQAKELPIFGCEVLNKEKDKLYPWHDVARYQVSTTNETLSLCDNGKNIKLGEEVRLLTIDDEGSYGPIDGKVTRISKEDGFFKYEIGKPITTKGFSGGAIFKVNAPGVVVGIHSAQDEKDPNILYGFLIGKDYDSEWVSVPRERLKGYDEFYANLMSDLDALTNQNASADGFRLKAQGTLSYYRDDDSHIICNNFLRKKDPGQYQKDRIDFLTNHAKGGNVCSQVELGEAYLFGRGVEADHGAAKEWFSKAAETGDEASLFYLAQMQLQDRDSSASDIQNALETLYRLWPNDNIAVACVLADYYAANKQIPLALCFARSYYHMAAEKGVAWAQLSYGTFLRFGYGGAPDIEQALYWIGLSADQGYAPAVCELACYYENGIGIARDLTIAARLYSQVVGDTSASSDLANYARYRFYFCLSLCYVRGTGVDVDINSAISCMHMAAEAGDSFAQYLLAYLYVCEEDGWYDVKASNFWIRMAARGGNQYAQELVGLNAYLGYADTDECIFKCKNKLETLRSCLINHMNVQAERVMQTSYRSEGAKEGWGYLKLQAESGNARAQLLLCLAAFARGDVVEAEKWARMAANQGYARGKYYLAFCYAFGRGVEKDEAMAVSMYKQLAEDGDPCGLIALGDCYRFGTGVAVDEIEAFKLYNAAAERGDALGQKRLGDCYRWGIGVEADPAEAFRLYKASAEQGDWDGQASLGDCYRWGIGVEADPAEAFRLYKASAEQGDSNGQASLGDCYRWGIGVEADPAEAFRLYKASAEQENAYGQASLGDCYRWGIGVEADPAEAFRLYKASAEQENAYGQASLGDCYRWGIGVEADPAEAFRLYKASAEQENAYGQASLGECYLFGVQTNVVEAAKLFNLSAEHGDSYGMMRLGECYSKGDGVESNVVEAVKWFRASAEQENSIGLLHLGECFAQGDGIEKNQTMAFENFMRAAEYDLLEACFIVGWCYENGFGVEKDLEEAQRWYDKVGDAKIEVSKENLSKDFLKPSSQEIQEK